MTTGKRSASRTPSAVDLRRARRRTIADVIAPRLRVLFGGSRDHGAAGTLGLAAQRGR
jgi:hypothetical protein